MPHHAEVFRQPHHKRKILQHDTAIAIHPDVALMVIYQMSLVFLYNKYYCIFEFTINHSNGLMAQWQGA